MGNKAWEGKALDTGEIPPIIDDPSLTMTGVRGSGPSNPDSFPAGVVLGCILGIGLTLIIMAVLGTVSMVCGS